ncbi:MAG: hypothetical protein J3K34DRAFT_524825 [Monoraphidium minutum]|nr:MAG: hypothetical protein J3K34DRAFT_524825 [Monoraphidium minutum]
MTAGARRLAALALVLLAGWGAAGARGEAVAPQPRRAPSLAQRGASAPGAAPVAGSATFAAALRDPAVSRLVLTRDVTLAPADFGWRNPIVLRRAVAVSACAPGAALDLGGNMAARVLVSDGGRLAFAGPALRLAGAAPVLRAPAWPDYNPLLIGLLEIEGGGGVALSDLVVTTNSPANATVRMERYPPEVRPALAVGARGASATVSSWNLTRAKFEAAGDGAPPAAYAGRRRLLGGGGGGAARAARRLAAAGGAAAARFAASRPRAPTAGAYWSFRNVTLDMPNTLNCFAELGLEGFPCDSGARLKAQLADVGLRAIAVVKDIKFDEAAFPREDANRLREGKGLNVSHRVEIRGCSTDPFNPVVIDFGQLPQYVFVFGRMTFSGNLRLVNSFASPRRADLWELIGALSVEDDGAVIFDGVEIVGTQPSPFHDFGDPFWDLYGGNPDFIANPADFQRRAPPPLGDRDVLLVNYTFVKDSWVRASQGTAGVVPIGGSAYWSYLNTVSMWAPDSGAAPGGGGGGGGLSRGAELGAAVGGALGGAALLAAAAGGLLVWRRRRRRGDEAGAAAAADASKSSDALGRSSDALGKQRSFGPPGGWSSTMAGESRTNMTGVTTSMGATERIEEARQQLIRQTAAAGASSAPGGDHVVLQELLGEGSFGKVFKALWKGTVVAVKTMVLPANMSGQEKREKMAIMETAISSSLSHPNIVHTYTYAVLPVRGTAPAEPTLAIDGNSIELDASRGTLEDPAAGADSGVHSWEVRLILEYCDKGTMRELLNQGCFKRPGGGRDLAGVMATALDVARAMVFLHENQIVHADLKARNVLLKSTGTDPRGFTAKVGDFGLSIRIDPGATHISNLFQGTMTHMAPETLDLGRISRASDVYAFGILLYELFTGDGAFRGVAKAMLGYEVVRLNRRPVFPSTCPFEYQLLAVRCWESDPAIRPTFEQVVLELERLERRIAPDGATLLPAKPGAAPPSAGGGAGAGAAGGAPLGAAAQALSARLGAPIPEELPSSSTAAALGSGLAASIDLATAASLEGAAPAAAPAAAPPPREPPAPPPASDSLAPSVPSQGGGAGPQSAMPSSSLGPGDGADKSIASDGVSGVSFEPSASSISMWQERHLLEAIQQQQLQQQRQAAAAAAAAAGAGADAAAGGGGGMGRIEEERESAERAALASGSAGLPGSLSARGAPPPGGRGGAEAP